MSVTNRLCVIDQTRPYTRPAVCDPCRSWLTNQLLAITRLTTQLSNPDGPPDSWATLGEQSRRLGKWTYDPIADQLPAGTVPGASTQPRVSGSGEPLIPINTDIADLTNVARLHSIGLPDWTDADGNTHPQIGHLSVTTELGHWVNIWYKALNERRPVPAPRVPALTAWLTQHLDWACSNRTDIADFATRIKHLAAVLRNAAGEVPAKPIRKEAPCPGCDYLTLYQAHGEDWIRCGNTDCNRVLSSTEYEQWTKKVLDRNRPGTDHGSVPDQS